MPKTSLVSATGNPIAPIKAADPEFVDRSKPAVSLYDREVDVETLFAAANGLEPSGYRLLIMLPMIKKKIGNILVDQEIRRQEQLAANIAYVVEVGPDAYSDKRKFPTGPWCKKGDWVVIKSYSGTRLKYVPGGVPAEEGIEFRFINDDSVEGVTTSPDNYQRI